MKFSPVSSAARRLESIDFLRGSAALAVILRHAATYAETPTGTIPVSAAWFRILTWLLAQGYLGVPLFFVISGFCIHMRSAKNRAVSGTDSTDFLEFWKRRLHRLYPPYLLVLCGSMALIGAAYLLHKNFPLLALYPRPKPRWMLLDFVAHLFMLHQFHPLLDGAGGNPSLWTLAREEALYLLYFILLAWRRAWRWSRVLAAVILIGITSQIILSVVFSAFGVSREAAFHWTTVEKSALALWIQWCLGMLACEAYCGLVKLPDWCYRIGLAPIVGLAAKTSETYCEPLSPLLWGLTFFILLNWCVQKERNGHWSRSKAVVWLTETGLFSYSLYLVHNPVRGIVKQGLGRLALTTSPWLSLLNIAIITCVCYIAGKGFFALVERRFLNVKAMPRFEKRPLTTADNFSD